MIRFEMDVLAADLRDRTIEGLVVPYGEVGRIAGVAYRFAPGSVRAARSRTPLLVDHDRGQPVGVLAELVEGPSGVLGRFTVDQTPAGDTALVQAASGSRGALSIGAEVVDSVAGIDGVIEVTSAELLEASLLALGAFPSASVTRVAAEHAGEPEPEPEVDDGEHAADDDPEDDDDDAGEGDAGDVGAADPNQAELPGLETDAGAAGETEPEGGNMTEATAAAPVILAGADRPRRDYLAGELVQLMIRAQHGDADARRVLVEAALTESISTDVSGLLPPQYETTVIGARDVDRPLYAAFRGRPLPGVGLAVNKPKWTTPPAGAWATDVNADATSSKVIIGAQSADVIRWDWAGAFPWVVVQRSSPDLIDSVYAEAVQDFYLDVEAKIYGELGAAAPGVATTLGAAIAEFYVATGNQRSPEVIVMAPDVWGAFADAGALSVPMGAGGVSGSELTTSFAGIRATTSGTLPAGETILATRRAVDARVTEPVRLTANAIGALNVELAVVGEGLFDTDYPAELLKFAGITPTIAAPAAARSRG